jgi:hypothetical protein
MKAVVTATVTASLLIAFPALAQDAVGLPGPTGPSMVEKPPQPEPAGLGPQGAPKATSDEGWEPMEVISGVALYKKDVPGAIIPAYRAVGELQVGIGKLVRIAFDPNFYTRWMAKVKVAQLVRQVSEKEAVAHLVLGTPWPIKDRDAVVKLQLEVEKSKRKVTLYFESTDDPDAPEPGSRVRAWMYPSRLVLTEVEPGRTKVEAEAHGDPRGSIPKWLVMMYQKNIPRWTLKRIYTAAMQPDVPPFPLWESRTAKQ